MRAFRRLRIAHKLMLIMMITSSVAVSCMAVAIFIDKALKEKRSIANQLDTLALIIGSRSTGALAFDDRLTAEETLNALSVKSNIVYAVIRRMNGSRFAEYRNPKGGLDASSLWVLGHKIAVARDIVLDGERIGRIRIVSNMDDFYANLVDQVSWTLIIMVSCFAVSFIIGSRLQKVVSDPIVRLRKAMNTVSTHQDYWVRVAGHTDDELGILTDGFNHMLQQIQIRDAELARYRANLEAEVATRTDELAQATRKRILWLQTLAGFLRHELKNATVGVRTSLELIDRRTQDGSIDVYIQRARKSISFMNTLLESVGNASSLEASIYQDVRSHLDLSELISTCMEEYRSSNWTNRLVVNCVAGIAILGNEGRLRQMLDKLVSNAIEHSNPETSIIISLERREKQAILCIINEGAKLPEDKERIFELFVSMRDSKHRRSENLGLGLYIVKLVAESHGGQVKARDLEDKEGAIFSVTLPIV
jgi:two-component system, sensor histidine kinase and response regulator